MDTLDKHLVKEFGLFFIVILIGLAFLYLGIDFFSNLWSIHLPIDTVITLYLYKVPKSIHQFVPVATLMACLLVLTNMSRQNEILCLYGGGVGILRILSTFVAMVSIICTISFIVFDRLNPMFERKSVLLSQGKDPANEQTLGFKEGRFWYRSGQLMYNVGRFNPELNQLEDINAYLMTPHSSILQRIYSKKAQWVNDAWELQNGFIVTYPEDTHYPTATSFESKRGVIPEKPSDFKSLKILEETMQLRDLRRYIRRNKAYGLDTISQEVNYQERLALVFTPLIFVLLGIPFATNPLKSHSMAKSIGLCCLLVFVYLLLSRFMVSLGKGGHFPPLVAGWSANVLFLGFAVYRVYKKKHMN